MCKAALLTACVLSIPPSIEISSLQLLLRLKFLSSAQYPPQAILRFARQCMGRSDLASGRHALALHEAIRAVPAAELR